MGTITGARREELQKAESGKLNALRNEKAIAMPIYKLIVHKFEQALPGSAYVIADLC